MKRTIDTQISAVEQAIEDVPKRPGHEYQTESLQCALTTLKWIKANRAAIIEVNKGLKNEKTTEHDACGDGAAAGTT